MRFAYLLLADASSVSEGKLNLLGIGARKVQPDDLPVNVSLTIAGAVEGTVDEAGDHHLEVALIEPDGAVWPLTSADAALPATADPDEPTLPVQFTFVLNFFRTYEKAGRHVIRATFGDLQEEYAFVVVPKVKKRARSTRKAR